MPATITKFGNVIFVDDGFQTVQYWSLSSVPNSFSFDSSTNIVKSRFFRYWGMDVPLSQLTISGVIPANEAAFDAALTTLSTLQTSGGGGGGGVAGVTGDLVSGTATNPIVNLAGTLWADRTVDLNGKILTFSAAGLNDNLRINSAVGSQEVFFDAFSDTDGGNDVFISVSATTSSASFQIDAVFDGGAKESGISGVASDLETKILYVTDIHDFQHGVIQYGEAPTGDAGDDNILVLAADFTINTRSISALSGGGLHDVGGQFALGGGGATGSDNPLVEDALIDVDGNSFYIFNGSDQLFELNPTGGSYRFGDVLHAGNGMQLSIQDDQSFVEIGNVTGAGGNNTMVRIKDDDQVITLIADNAILDNVSHDAFYSCNGIDGETDDVIIAGLTNTYTLSFVGGIYTGTVIS